MAPSAKMYLPATTPQPQQIAHPIHHQHPKQEQLPTRSANHAPPSDRGIYTCEPTPSVPSLTWRAAQRWRSSSAPSAREPPLRARPTSSGPRRSSWRCGRAAPQAARRRPPPFRPGPGWRCEKKKKKMKIRARPARTGPCWQACASLVSSSHALRQAFASLSPKLVTGAESGTLVRLFPDRSICRQQRYGRNSPAKHLPAAPLLTCPIR